MADPKQPEQPTAPAPNGSAIVAEVRFRLTAKGDLLSAVSGDMAKVLLALELGKHILLSGMIGRGPEKKGGRIVVPGSVVRLN